jgi:regulatory protein
MGGTITALEAQKRNKERVNVYLDGEFAFGLTVLEAARLRKGQTLSDSEIAALKAHDSVEQAYESAVRFLGNRPRSITEVRRNLTEKEVVPSVIEEVIARLESRGYVDDVAFARFWVGNRQQFKPRGTRALRFELREKGVSNEVIDQVLSEVDTSDAAYQAALDKAKRLRNLDKRTFREKLGAFLARRGFDYDTVGEVVNRLINEFEEKDADAFLPSRNDIEE